MAPEQADDPARADHRVDIYAMGVVLYELLTGELPSSKLQPPSRKVRVDVRIDEIVLRALEKEPEQRYQTAEQFRRQIESMPPEAARTSPKVESEPLQRSIVDQDKRRLEYTVTALISLLIGVVWGYFSDLRNGQVGWFIGRILFVPLFTVGLTWLFFRLTQNRAASGAPTAASETRPHISASQTATSAQRDADATGRRRWVRRALISIVLIALAATLLFWIQRPQRWDTKTISADSPDGMYSTSGQTWHTMRVFSGDRTFDRFVVQGRGGSVYERWEVPVPTEVLAKDYVLLSMDEISFSLRGSIVWSDDSMRVSFRVSGIEVAAFNVADHSHAAPTKALNGSDGFRPVIERDLVGSESLTHCFLDADTGRVLSAPRELLESLRTMGQFGPSLPQVATIADWARVNVSCSLN